LFLGGTAALIDSIPLGESKALITLTKAAGYSGEKATSSISIKIVRARDFFINDLLTLSNLLWVRKAHTRVRAYVKVT